MLAHYRISIIDRNEIAREGLRRMFSERGFGMVETRGDSASIHLDPHHLVVITCADYGEALSHCRFVRSQNSDVRIAILAQDCCSDIVVDALAAGADGVLSKAMMIEPLMASLHLIALGEKVIPTCVVEDLPARPRLNACPVDQSDLSNRELAVLDRIAAGRANKLISRDLGITEGTVKVHVKAILRKLGVSNRTQAALWAAEKAMIPSHLVPHSTQGMVR